jgi:hypothetical protein
MGKRLSLAEWLRLKKLTLREAEVLLGVDKATLHRATRGKNVNIENARKIRAGTRGRVDLTAPGA